MTIMTDFAQTSTGSRLYTYCGSSSPVRRIRTFPHEAEYFTVRSEARAVTTDEVEEQDVRAYVSALWAEDWDSPEDQSYDAM